MNAYSSAFVEYVKSHPLKDGDVEMESVLELFYTCYTERNSADSEKMRDCFRQIDELTEPLAREDSEQIFSLLCALCAEAQHCAFLEGFRIGGRWGLEMR